jgi:hypothetical protein
MCGSAKGDAAGGGTQLRDRAKDLMSDGPWQANASLRHEHSCAVAQPVEAILEVQVAATLCWHVFEGERIQ